jgi:anti-sigma-K factor RskA
VSHEPYSELAAAYALGALEGEERSRFEAHLRAGCPECDETLRAHGESLAGVAGELPPVAPPPSVKAALLERIAAEARPGAEPAGARAIQRPRRRWTAWQWGWASAAAAAFILVVAALGMKVDSLSREVEEARQQVAALTAQVAQQRELLAILRSPETEVVTLAGLKPSPAARGRVWWNPEAGGIFVANALPATPPGKAYQLWAIAAGKPVNAGVFDVDPKGTGGLRVKPLAGVRKVDVFAVTLEPAGGLPQPSGEMYLASKS